MATPSTIDFESLLRPIPGENPAGADVRYTRYDIIKEARRADEGLPQGDWKPKGAPKTADWGKVIEVASTVISTESKDLQVAVWLLEALVKRHHFAGLRDGVKLIRELHEQFWETLYPIIEDGDRDYRASPIEWMNEKEKSPFFPITVKGIPVLHSPDGEEYSFKHWEESRTVDNLGRQSAKAMAEAIAEGKVTKAQIDKAEASTPLTRCMTLLEDVRQGADEIQALDQVLKEKFGEGSSDRPSVTNVMEAVESCRIFLDETVHKKGGAGMSSGSMAPQKDEKEGLEVGSENARSQVRSSGGIEPVDRLDALRRLAAVAEFFRRTEPHSPVSYLVQRATKWGEMPLDEWLNEVIKSKDVLGAVRETLGIKDENPKQ
ncbi:MAG: type VI secretion system protein TssA [Nitrospirales bacterium]